MAASQKASKSSYPSLLRGMDPLGGNVTPVRLPMSAAGLGLLEGEGRRGEERRGGEDDMMMSCVFRGFYSRLCAGVWAHGARGSCRLI